jgi:hypothetical protein
VYASCHVTVILSFQTLFNRSYVIFEGISLGYIYCRVMAEGFYFMHSIALKSICSSVLLIVTVSRMVIM